MVDWAYGLEDVTFEFWQVDRESWADARPIDNVVEGSMVRDAASRGREGSALVFAGSVPEEAIVRCYMRARQAGSSERVALGTWMLQRESRNPTSSATEVHCSLYSPIIALASRGEDTGGMPPLGYTVPAGVNCVEHAAREMRAHGVAPVIACNSADVLQVPHVASVSDAWLDVCDHLAAAAACEVGVDAFGRTVITPAPNISAARPSWTFHDGNSQVKSNILPETRDERSLHRVPNVVNVVWNRTRPYIDVRAADDDPSRTTSRVRRGYEVIKRVVNPPELQAGCSAERAQLLADRLLADCLRVTRTITVVHPYCPAYVGDVVEVDYADAQITGVGRIARQTMGIEVGAKMTSFVEVEEDA